MSENFLKFKRRYNSKRLLYSSLGALGGGLFVGGITLLLSKLAVIPIEPIFSAVTGALALLLTFAVLALVTYRTDKLIARKLDKSFALSERVETMLDFKDEQGVMLDMQRQDTDERLAGVSAKNFKVFGLWAAIAAAAFGALCLVGAVIAPDMRDYQPPEEVIPFELTDMQRAGINELIVYTETSAMEEPYRTETVTLLRDLLSTLEKTETQPAMRAALAETMAYLLEITSRSSSMTELANALWNVGDPYTQMFARVVDTSSWREPDWGDFAEKYAQLAALYEHKPQEGEVDLPADSELVTELKWKLESTSLKVNSALSESGIVATDGLYAVLAKFAGEGDAASGTLGFASLVAAMSAKTHDEAKAMVDASFAAMSTLIYAELESDRNNTLVGEYVMTKLSTLFLVPLPAFERPDFSKNGAGGDSGGEKEDKEENEGSGGGIGTGAVYGSNDLVLDPLTGEYVEYGTLLDKYFSVMNSKLENGGYTEQQKEAIKKYFALLYGGMKKDEGK